MLKKPTQLILQGRRFIVENNKATASGFMSTVKMSRKNSNGTSSNNNKTINTIVGTKTDTHITPEDFISKLSPLKRILFVCPVAVTPFPNQFNPKDGKNYDISNNNACIDSIMTTSEEMMYSISMAISDPYLSYAIPINMEMKDVVCWSDSSLSGLQKYTNEHISNMLLGEEIFDAHCYTDIGGIVFGLPMKSSYFDGDDDDVYNNDQRIKNTEEFKIITKLKNIRDLLGNNYFIQSQSHNNPTEISLSISERKHSNTVLQCYVDNQLSLDEAIKMANEEPEMWEEITDQGYSMMSTMSKVSNDPSFLPIHAAVGLNAFLWQHTGGWRNTFA